MPWTQFANIKGPRGDQGPQGAEGPQGIQGPPGEDGAGIEIAGSVPTYAGLPTTLGAADAGDGYLVESDGRLYIWDGTAFPADGAGVEFRGPQGIQGPQGEVGPEGPQGIQGVAGADGATGPAGPRGNKWFRGSGTPTTVDGSMAGDFYLDQDTGLVYELS